MAEIGIIRAFSEKGEILLMFVELAYLSINREWLSL